MVTNEKRIPVVFGEVLFDCFPGGENVLGGAPFNVAWHLAAFGDSPCFISRVGQDGLGSQIKEAMKLWGMSLDGLQESEQYPTGQVKVSIVDHEPQYQITPDCAYDFIESDEMTSLPTEGLIYHGSLALRNKVSRQSFVDLSQHAKLPCFMDVNLRSPWWEKHEVLAWLGRATWAKLNEDELYLLYGQGELFEKMNACMDSAHLEWLIVTRGADGAVALTKDAQVLTVEPEEVDNFVDTVGAGDAFTAVLLHGILNDWPLQESLNQAQQFASAIVGQRGATPMNRSFYYPFPMKRG